MPDPDADFREPHLRQADFLGAFAVVETSDGILMVQNRRHIAGAEVLTWDLPGGQVEPGETLVAALHRELDEETGISVVGETPFLFVQEGQRSTAGCLEFAWRSFFFAVSSFDGVPRPAAEVLAVRWVARAELRDLLHAPYHDSFLAWIEQGGRFFSSGWHE